MSDLSSLLAPIRKRVVAYRDHGTPGLHAPQDRAKLLAAVDQEYIGTQSGFIPATAFRDGSVIVGVDWSERGWADVTFLTPGRPAWEA